MLDRTGATHADPHGRVEVSGRRIKLSDFEDGGLTAGLRTIHLYLPEGYDDEPDARYPVVYFNDGGNAFSRPAAGGLDVDLAHDALVAEGLIGPAILVRVGIASLPGRVKDLSPTADSGYRGCGVGVDGVGGGLEGYYTFLSDHLKPFIDRSYRTLPGPSTTGIAGYSLGGSAAFLMAFLHPETFGLSACMWPAFWWSDDWALRRIDEDTRGKKPTRFWLDAGGSDGEYPAWRRVARAYESLERKGWIPGDDLAAFFDYAADHRFESGAARMRHILHFLLRREPLHLESYRLVAAVDPTAPVMDLNATPHRRQLIGAEAIYAEGLRLSVPQPELIAADPGVVSVDANDPLLLRGVAFGQTTITSTFQGRTAALPVVGYDPRTYCPVLYDCSADVAADTLFYTIPDSADVGSAVARFGVRYDTAHVHIVVRVRQDSLVVADDKLPWQQDSVGFNFDANPEPELSRGLGETDTDGGDFLNVVLSPRPLDQAPCIFPALPDWAGHMPVGASAACRIEPGGYVATLSIPTSYLDEKQSANRPVWGVFRLNVYILRFEEIGGACQDVWWNPDWPVFESPIDSGFFIRS